MTRRGKRAVSDVHNIEEHAIASAAAEIGGV